MSESSYSDKLARLEGQTLLPRLAAPTRDFLRRTALHYRFTLQEIRQTAETARDLEMWREEPLESWWNRAEAETVGDGRGRKKALLERLVAHRARLRAVDTRYPDGGLQPPPRRSVRLQPADSGGEIFGRCPAYSDQTVCCSLRTIDVVRGCPFGCSYCTIQTFYGETAELESDLAAKLDAIELDPNHLYHVGTGQASDSLVWGNRGGVIDQLLGFARQHSNVVLELKTKSDNVTPLLLDRGAERLIPPNVLCSWSLSPDSVIVNEEHGTASLDRRLAAARSVVDRGLRVGFHFHPMVSYEGWRPDYTELAARLRTIFDADDVAFVSMGAPTFIRPVVREIRRRGGETKILQSELVADHHGKLTYPDAVKIELYRHLFGALSPWHNDVFFYLCMEAESIWRRTLGWSYPTNAAFERAFAMHCLQRPDENGPRRRGLLYELGPRAVV